MNVDVEKLIQSRIDDMDFETLARDEMRSYIKDAAEAELKKVTREEIQAIIKGAIAEAMQNGVETNDGWGKVEKFESFEQMFKIYLKKALNETYNIRNTVETFIKNETKNLVEKHSNEIAEVIKRSLTK